MNVTVDANMLDLVIRHAQEAYPKEGCGLIAGTLTGQRFIPVRNVSDSPNAYEMDPQELIDALRNIRTANEQLIAIYHSHPNAPARPSRHDVDRAYYPDAAYLIVSLEDPKRPQTAAFRIVEGEVLEVELRAIV
jgi:proteasome lid subunit RPN8/RPN11